MKTLGLVAYPDGEVKLETVEPPELGENPYAPHDVLCEVQYCGICGSDVHRWKSDKTGVKSVPSKVVIGHEIVSVVKDVGSQVTKVKPGDRVVHEIVTSFCGYCKTCREGRFNICLERQPMEGRAHFVTGGGFTKYVVWPEQQLHPLPGNIDTRQAVLIEPTAGSVHSVVTRMGVRAGESVAILGPGARGLLMLQVCKAVGAGPVMVTGMGRDKQVRLPTARELGADYTICADEQDVGTAVRELIDGHGVDVVLENTGSSEPISQSLDIVRKGGRALWAGAGIRGGVSAEVDTYQVIVKELDIRGEISQVPYDWDTAIQLVSTGAVRLGPLVTHTFPLERWEEGFDLAASSAECLRVAIEL